MTVRPCAGFIANFPDDTVEDEHDIVMFGGRNVAEAIGKILTDIGCRVLPPEYAEAKGWEFVLYYKSCMFWCQVTSYHPVFQLMFDDTAVFRGTRKRNAADYTEIADRLAAALAGDSRFHDIVWRSREEGPPEPDEILPDQLRPPSTVQIIEPVRPLPPERRNLFKRPSLVRSLFLILLGIGLVEEACVLDVHGDWRGVVLLPIGGLIAIGGVLGWRTWRRR